MHLGAVTGGAPGRPLAIGGSGASCCKGLRIDTPIEAAYYL